MNGLTIFGASAVTVMLRAYILERRAPWWMLIFALACAASSAYGWLAGWRVRGPLAVIEGIWALVAFHRWWGARTAAPRA